MEENSQQNLHQETGPQPDEAGYPEPQQQPIHQAPEPERILYQWQAPSRLYKKRNREFFTTVAAIVILLSMILVFAKEFLLIAVILALGFVAYALASVKPENVEHILTNKGVRTAGKLYEWQFLGRYWMEEKWKQWLVHVELPFQFPGKLMLLIGEGDKEIVEEIFATYLINEIPEPTFLDRASEWLQEKVPLETE